MSIPCVEYKNIKASNELLEILSEAEDDVKQGRVAPIEDTFKDIKKQVSMRHPL